MKNKRRAAHAIPKVSSSLSRAAFALSLFLVLTSGCMANRIIRVSDKAEVKLPELIDKAKGFRLVFVGELHETKWHHRVQLEVIRGLYEAGVPVAIGLEMFMAESQKDLDMWVSGEIDYADFIDIYYSNWHIPWRQYSGIFYYARDNNIPLVGLNVSRKIIHRVFKKGYKSLTPEEKKGLPPVKCEIDPAYEEFIRGAMEEHENSEESFQNFCEAQMVWDTTMASNAVRYLEANPDRMMVVLAGSGHSWRRGIPEQVRKQSGMPSLVILPELPHRLKIEDATTKDADYIWEDP